MLNTSTPSIFWHGETLAKPALLESGNLLPHSREVLDTTTWLRLNGCHAQTDHLSRYRSLELFVPCTGIYEATVSDTEVFGSI